MNNESKDKRLTTQATTTGNDQNLNPKDTVCFFFCISGDIHIHLCTSNNIWDEGYMPTHQQQQQQHSKKETKLSNNNDDDYTRSLQVL